MSKCRMSLYKYQGYFEFRLTEGELRRGLIPDNFFGVTLDDTDTRRRIIKTGPKNCHNKIPSKERLLIFESEKFQLIKYT